MPLALAFMPDWDTLLVAEGGSGGAVRRVQLGARSVSTLAGGTATSPTPGSALSSGFLRPAALCVASWRDAFVLDSNANVIMRVRGSSMDLAAGSLTGACAMDPRSCSTCALGKGALLST